MRDFHWIFRILLLVDIDNWGHEQTLFIVRVVALDLSCDTNFVANLTFSYEFPETFRVKFLKNYSLWCVHQVLTCSRNSHLSMSLDRNGIIKVFFFFFKTSHYSLWSSFILQPWPVSKSNFPVTDMSIFQACLAFCLLFWWPWP